MANNTTLPGTGEVYSSDEVTNEDGVDVNYQIIKLGQSEQGETPVQISPKDPLSIHDNRNKNLFEDILIELKLIRLHQEQITGQKFKSEDVQ